MADKVRINVGDKLTRNGIVYEIIGKKPGGKVELFDRVNCRFTDKWHKDVINWERVA